MQDAGCPDWWRLTPDDTGSYVNGTWTQIASLPSGYAPLYHSSAVLPDGRVIIEGGEYNFYQGLYFVPIWTAEGAIYDPAGEKRVSTTRAPSDRSVCNRWSRPFSIDSNPQFTNASGAGARCGTL